MYFKSSNKFAKIDKVFGGIPFNNCKQDNPMTAN